jgi:putative proteasome-type protease
MSYCLGIVTRDGLVMGADSRTNAGYDQLNVVRKLHVFARDGERIFVVLTSGSLSLSQSIVEGLRRDFERGAGLGTVESMYDGARAVGAEVRRVSDLDRAALERDTYQFNVSLILGGQIGTQPPGLFLIYPQGNPVRAGEDSPYLQIGESKYGRPILDRGVRFDRTTLDEAVKYALISLDSTMRSNATVGPPIDLLVYSSGSLRVSRHRRLDAEDPELKAIRAQWDDALRRAVHDLPDIRFDTPGPGPDSR